MIKQTMGLMFRFNECASPWKYQTTYPVHLTDVMDVSPSNQGDLFRSNFVSPVRGTRTRAVREYEQTIDELKKENFDLKLRIYLFEEGITKTLINQGCSEDPNNVVRVIVDLQVQAEEFKADLTKKEVLLKETSEIAEKYENDLRESNLKVKELQEQNESLLQKLQELPSKNEVQLLLDERNSLLDENANINYFLSEKEASLSELQAQLENLTVEKNALENKVKKSSLAIQGIVYKYHKDTQNIPKEIRQVVQSGVQAAKDSNRAEVVAAVEAFNASLFKILSISSDETTSSASPHDDNKENVSQKDSMEEFQRSLCGSQSSENLVQTSKSSHPKSKNELIPQTSSDYHSASSSKSHRENLQQMVEVTSENLVLKVDVQEKTRLIENQVAQITELEQKVTQLQKQISESVSKYRDIELKYIEERSKSASSIPSDRVDDLREESLRLSLVIDEKDKEIEDLKEKLSKVEKLSDDLSKHIDMVIKSVPMSSTAVQCRSEVSDKLLQTSDLMQSESIDDLREEYLRLSLVIEEKDKEIADLKETLLKIRPAEISTNVDMEYLNERDELHQKLADCSAVNHDLLKHLKSLETFMENLLLNKTMDSSIDSSNEASNYLSQLTSYLDQTLRLSNVLSDRLSVCEGSKIFDPSDFTMNKEYNQDRRTSLSPSDHSQIDVSTTIRGRNKFKLSDRDILKHTSGTGKRRLSFSNSQNSDMGSENLVYLGTSNNEDLLLLLNERGDPKDVLIRNSQEKVLPPFNDGPQRRYWDPLGTNQWKAENNPFGQHISNWHASQLMNSGKFGTWHNHCPSSDSDIWSEPDREVSSQRIGIDVQKSPIAQKSPRRSRVKGRSTDEHSSHVNESSSGILKILPLSKRRRFSDSSRSSNICKKYMTHQTAPAEESGFEAVIKVLEGKLLQYEAECKRLRNELSESNLENHDLKQTVRDMEQELSQHDVQCEQLISELSETKSKLISVEAKCSELENKLSLSCKDKEEWEIYLKASEDEKQKLVSEIESLVSYKNELLKRFHLEKQAKENVEREKYLLNLNVREGQNKCEQLQSELNETKYKLAALDSKCSELESKLTLSTKSKEEWEKNFKVSESEKQKLVSEIENLLESVKVEKQARESLKKEKHQLNADLSNKESMITSLQASIKSSEEKAISFLREKEVLENKLLSFNSTCNELKEELSRVKEQLEDMQLKCSTYKKELNKASTFKQEVNDKLSSLISEFVPNVNKLKNVCNHYLNLNESVTNLMEPNFDLISDKDVEIKNKLEIIVSANVILEQKISLLSEAIFRSKSKENLSDVLSSVQHELKMKEDEIKQLESQNQIFKTKMDDRNNKLKNNKICIDELKLQAETYHQELFVSRKESQLLQNQYQELQNVIQDLQQSIEEKDKLVFSNKMKETSLMKQVSTLENHIENYKHQIIQSDDEITKLQERIFNLQTQLNCLLTEKANSTTQTEMKSIESTATGSKEVLVPSREIGVDSENLIQYRTTGSGSKEVLTPSREVGVDSESLIQYRNTASGSKEVLIPSRDVGLDAVNPVQYLEIGPDSGNLVQCREVGVDSGNPIQYRTTGSGSKEVLVPSREVALDSESLIQYRTTGSGSKEVLVPAKEVGVDPGNLFEFRATGSGSKEVLVPSREVGVDSTNLVPHKEAGSGSKEALVPSRSMGSGSQEILIPCREVGVDSENLIQYRTSGVQCRVVGVEPERFQCKEVGSGSQEVLVPTREIGVDSQPLIQFRTTGSGSKEVILPSREVGVDSKNLIQYKDTGSDSKNIESNEPFIPTRETGTGSKEDPIPFRNIGISAKEVFISSREAGIGSEEVSFVNSRYFYSDIKMDTADHDLSYSSSISDTEKTQVKKLNDISAKLHYYKKRIEVLTKEKQDLREELIVQIEGNRRASKLSSDLGKELSEMEDKLEAKTSFVKDLKKELQTSYNLLIEKQKEVDEWIVLYKQAKEISAAKTKFSIQEAFEEKSSDPFHLKTESNISDLRKHKWDLVKEIFKLQKQFYEKKNIHLKHFEKFKSHIEKLRALQASFQKSGSEPMLNTSLPASCGYVEKYDRPLHFLQIELELDVEYLQNFKIFLKRFFIPVTLQKCQCSEFDPKNDSSTAKPSLKAEKETSFSANKCALKLNLENPTSMELLHSSSDSTTNRLVQAASERLHHKVASLENLLRSLKFQFSNLNVLESLSEEKKSATKSVLAKIESDLNIVEENTKQICELNSLLKSLNMSLSYVPTSPNKDLSDRESVLSEETITLSRSGSLSPMSSFEEHFPTKLSSKQNTERCKTEEELQKGMKEKQALSKPNPVGGSLESIVQRSHFSSPDLGIESDPNHEGSAPEQAEVRDNNSRKWLDISSKGKHMPAVMNTNTELIDDFSRIISGESLHSVGLLQHYKLLKKEVQESLVGIKIILSRTKDVLHHTDRFSSPRKNIESTTFKAIRDECQNIEICLEEAAKLVNNFWIAPCPSEKDLKTLVQLNQDLQSQIVFLQESKKRQQISFEEAMEKLKVAEDMRDKIEKNISRKLVKTKKVMREVENKMLHKRNEAQLPLPKYPSERPHQTEK